MYSKKDKLIMVVLFLLAFTFGFSVWAQGDDYYNTSINYSCTDPAGCPDDVDPTQMTQEEIDAYNAAQIADYERRQREADERYQQQLRDQSNAYNQRYDQYQQEMDQYTQTIQNNAQNYSSSSSSSGGGAQAAVGAAAGVTSMAGIAFADKIAGNAGAAAASGMQSAGMWGMAASMVGMLGDGEAAQYASAGLNVVASVKHYKVASSCCNPGTMGCCVYNIMAGTMSAAQAGLSAANAGKTDDAEGDLSQLNNPEMPTFNSGAGGIDSTVNPEDVAGPNLITGFPNVTTGDPNDTTTLSDVLGDLDDTRTTITNDLPDGWNYNPNGPTITGPNGETYRPSDFANPTAMANAGFSPAEIASIQQNQRDIANQMGLGGAGGAGGAFGGAGGGKDGLGGVFAAGLNSKNADVRKIMENAKKIAENSVASSGFKGGGGGARGGKGVGPDGLSLDGESEDPLAALMKRFGKKRKKAAGRGLASLTKGSAKRLGNDLIGHKNENIFEMVHRRYRMKAKQGQFLRP